METKVKLLHAKQGDKEDQASPCCFNKFKYQIYVSTIGILLLTVIVLIIVIAMGGLNISLWATNLLRMKSKNDLFSSSSVYK